VKLQNQPKKRNKSVVLVTLSLLLGLAASGCSGSNQVPVTAPKPIAAKPVQKPVSLATPTDVGEKAPAAYSYNPQGRRDPFASIIVKEEKQAKMGDRPPLERFNISEFKLTGVVWGGLGYNAMVEGPDGKGYFIHVGTVIGMNKGVVKKIMQNRMVIEEKFKNFSGETERREIVIELRKKQEEMQ
jgi:type IV pilus assembly protein PilP